MTRQRQIRGFVLAWLGITLVMGALTFAGIYYATGLVGEDETVGVAALSNADAEGLAAAPAPAIAAAALAAPPRAENPVEEQSAAPAEAGASVEEEQAAPVAKTAPEQAEQAAPAADEGQGGEPTGQPLMAAAAPPQDAAPGGAQVATPVPTPTLRPIEVTGFQLGIQVQPNADPEIYKLWMGEVRDKLKLGWIKQQVRWEDVEPQPGVYNWGELDVSLPLAKEYGIKVMLSIVTAPDWAREPGNQRLDEVGPPADPQTYANFITTLLYRYPGMVHAIEVWNEMNIDREWASIYGLNAQNYVTLLRTAYKAIKAVDPGIIVISGALSPTGWNDGVQAYDDFVYMDMLIQAGMLETTDCVGAHHNGYNIGPNVPWNQVPNDPTATFRGPFDNPHHSWSFYSTLNGYAQRIQQAGSDKKLCVTEFGWPTTEDLNGYPRGFEFANDNTLAEQAQFIGEAIEAMESWGFVWLAWIWNLNYGPQAGWDATNDNVPYSLLRPEWQQAPVYEVIASHNFRER
jgi:hypothetical protein